MAATRVLLVDDDDQVRSALGRFLTKSGYDVVQANGGEAALERLADAGPFEAMISDIRMPPGMSGVDLLPKAIAHDPDMAILMLTAVGEPQSAIECLRLGAADYLIKPIEVEELQHALQYALRKRELEVDRRELEQWLAREVAEKTQELEEQSLRVELLSLSILTELVDATEPRGGERNHSQRVSNLAAHIAAAMGLTSDDIENVRLAARLHSLGRMGHILAPLRHHAAVVEMIRRQADPWPDSPTGARIIAVANLFDELTEEPLGDAPVESPAEAMAALEKDGGGRYDPAVVSALRTVVSNRL